MIIEQLKEEILISDGVKGTEIQLDTASTDVLWMLLSKGLYSDPVTAVIAEYTNNAVDAVVAAGKNPVECPVIITLGRNIQNSDYAISFKDEGVNYRLALLLGN